MEGMEGMEDGEEQSRAMKSCGVYSIAVQLLLTHNRQTKRGCSGKIPASYQKPRQGQKLGRGVLFFAALHVLFIMSMRVDCDDDHAATEGSLLFYNERTRQVRWWE